MKTYTVNTEEKTVDVNIEATPNGWKLEELGITDWEDDEDLSSQLMGEDLPDGVNRLPFYESGDNVVFPEVSIFDKFEYLRDELDHVVFEELNGSSGDSQKNYNTDILIWKDGTITTYNYFGSCEHRNADIELVITVSAQDKASWREYWEEGMTPEQIEYCNQRGWYCCWESDSKNPKDWKEYHIDFVDYISSGDNIAERAIENYENEIR